LKKGENMVEMKKTNWKIGVGCLACATFIFAPIGIPMILLGMWENYVDYKNKKIEELVCKGRVNARIR
jgi:hypothetical protein